MLKSLNAVTCSKFNICFILLLILLAGCGRENITNTVDDNLPPVVPVNLEVFYSQDGTIGIDWQKNTDPDLKGYNIYRKIEDGNYQGIAFTTSNYFYNDSLSYDKRYFYRVTAIDIYNHESLPSEEVSGVPKNVNPPLPPKNLLINARNIEGNLSIYLTWDKTYDGDVFNYNIYRSTNPDFAVDSSSLIGTTSKLEYSDTLNLQLYTTYYYSIRAVDNGTLLSNPTNKVSDEILGIAQPIYPENNSYPGPFSNFKILTLSVPATYQIIVQTNPYFGDFWSKTFSSNLINDTLSVNFDAPYVEYNSTYYWRVITYSPGETNPNSISQQFKFTTKY